MEIRNQQELQQITNNMNMQHLDLPDNFQKCNLLNKCFTPTFDKSCHNVQGINVWSNTAPRGWASMQSTHHTAGQKTTQLNQLTEPPRVVGILKKEKGMMQKQDELKFEQQRMDQQYLEEQLMEQQLM